MLFVDGRGHQHAAGAGHVSSQLGGDSYVAHAGGHEHLFVYALHLRADVVQIGLRLLGMVGNADAAGQVDHEAGHARLLLHLARQIEQQPGHDRVVIPVRGVGGQEGVQRKLLYAHVGELFHGLKDLFLGHAVFGIPGFAHHRVAQCEFSAGIEAQADLLRDAAVRRQKVDVGDVVQVDDGPQLSRQLILLGRRLVGGEHDFLAGESAGLRQHQLGQRGAVHAAALLLVDGQNRRVRQCLDGEVLPESGVPVKRGVQMAGALAQHGLVIQVKRRRMLLDDFLQLLFAGTETGGHRNSSKAFVNAFVSVKDTGM